MRSAKVFRVYRERIFGKGEMRKMGKRKYPDMFYSYAFSGQAKCNECKGIIKQGHFVFVYKGNIYHDVCSQDLKEREKLQRFEGVD